jgi:hypothetical protein
MAPQRSMAEMVATAVLDTEITLSPLPTPQARRANSRASVPLATPMASFAPNQAANSCSKAATSGPKMYQPLSKTR